MCTQAIVGANLLPNTGKLIRQIQATVVAILLTNTGRFVLPLCDFDTISVLEPDHLGNQPVIYFRLVSVGSIQHSYAIIFAP